MTTPSHPADLQASTSCSITSNSSSENKKSPPRIRMMGYSSIPIFLRTVLISPMPGVVPPEPGIGTKFYPVGAGICRDQGRIQVITTYFKYSVFPSGKPAFRFINFFFRCRTHRISKTFLNTKCAIGSVFFHGQENQPAGPLLFAGFFYNSFHRFFTGFPGVESLTHKFNNQVRTYNADHFFPNAG